MGDNEIKGFITITKKEEKEERYKPSYIWEYFTYPKNQGYGSKLMKKVREDEKRSYLYLHVKKDITETINIYEHQGFVKKGYNCKGTKYKMDWMK